MKLLTEEWNENCFQIAKYDTSKVNSEIWTRATYTFRSCPEGVEAAGNNNLTL